MIYSLIQKSNQVLSGHYKDWYDFTTKCLFIQSINVVVVGSISLLVTSLWNYFYNQIPCIITYASNGAEQQIFVYSILFFTFIALNLC